MRAHSHVWSVNSFSTYLLQLVLRGDRAPCSRQNWQKGKRWGEKRLLSECLNKHQLNLPIDFLGLWMKQTVLKIFRDLRAFNYCSGWAVSAPKPSRCCTLFWKAERCTKRYPDKPNPQEVIRNQEQGTRKKIRHEQMGKLYYALCVRSLHSEATVLSSAGEQYKWCPVGAFNLKLLPLLWGWAFILAQGPLRGPCLVHLSAHFLEVK